MKRLRRSHVLALFGTSAVAAAALAAGAVSAPDPPLPDLVSEAPQFDENYPYPALEKYVDGRLLVRFNGYVTNSASAASPLEIRASNPDANLVMQNVVQYGGSTAPGVGGTALAPAAGGPPIVRFEAADDHNHFHLKNAAEYALFTEDTVTMVARAQKTEAGFCLEDSLNAGGGGAQVYDVDSSNFCRNQPLTMGISPGWKDRYGAELSYQWVDLSNVQPGKYQLAARVDPTNVIRESNESNNGYKYLPYTLAGYVASPVSTPADRGRQADHPGEHHLRDARPTQLPDPHAPGARHAQPGRRRQLHRQHGHLHAEGRVQGLRQLHLRRRDDHRPPGRLPGEPLGRLRHAGRQHRLGGHLGRARHPRGRHQRAARRHRRERPRRRDLERQRGHRVARRSSTSPRRRPRPADR